jgi:predicted transcriptional regulator
MEALMEVLAQETFDLIVIDTVFKHFTKFDPSSPLGALAIIAACEQIRRKSGAAVMLNHHAVKGGKGKGIVEFGGAPVMAGIDTAIAVDRRKEFITLICKNQRNEKDFDPIRLQTKFIELERGDKKVTVPVVTDCDSGNENGNSGRSEVADRVSLLKLLIALRDLGGRAMAKEIYEKAGISQAGFHRFKDKLMAEQWISQAGDRQPYELTEKGMEALKKLSEDSHER